MQARVKSFLLLTPMTLFAVAAAGLLAGYGNPIFAGVAIGAIAVGFLLVRPDLSLWFTLIGGLVLTGFTQLYLPQLQLIRWAVALFAAVLGIMALANYMFRSTVTSERLPAVLWWMLAFMGIAILSSIVNYAGMDTLLYGLKGYLQVWGLLFALVMMKWDDKVIERLPKLLMGVALIQLPFVLHQYLFIVPNRIGVGGGIVAEDVIAGTLGASMNGGGANAVLSLVLLMGSAIVLAMFKRQLITPLKLLMALGILLLPVMLNSNRISLFYLMLIYLMLFGRDVLREPAKAIMMAVAFVLIIGAVFWSYSQVLSNSEPHTDWRSFIEHTIQENTEQGVGYGKYELNRLTSITFWVHEHVHAPWSQIMLGHGAGASRDAEGGQLAAVTLAQKKYVGFGIGLTSISAILWDMGVAGLVCLFITLWVAYRSAGRLASVYKHVPPRAAVFQGLQVGVVLFTVSLIHKSSLTFHLPYQTLLLMTLGYIGYWDVRSRRADERLGEASIGVTA